MKTTPFWTDDFPRPVDLPSSVLPEQVEVAIVGGGYTGLAAAHTLAQAGTRVVVLEQQLVGSGASSMNGGQVSSGLKEDVQVMFRRYGPELARALWDASVESVYRVERLVQEEQLDCDFSLSGSMALAYRPKHYQSLISLAEWRARELDYAPHQTLIPPDKLCEEIGTDVFFGGLINHLGGGLHPAKFVYGLAGAAVRSGALLVEETQVQRIDRVPGSSDFQISTSQGQLRTAQLLIATNGYTGSLVPDLRRRIFPVGSYIITTEPLPTGLQQELSPKNHMFWDTKWLLNYFRLTPDGRLAMGGRNNLSPDLDLAESAQFLRQIMLRIFPQLSTYSLSHSWSGRLGLTFDLTPHIGRIQGIYYALGYCGHGAALAVYLGQEVANLMLGQIHATPFAEIPHPTYFFYRKNPWFLPLVAAYYRLLDRIS